MQVQGASPAQSAPLPAQAISALTVPTPTKQSTPLSPTGPHSMTTPAAPPSATATPPVVDPMQDLTADNTLVNHTAPTPIDPEAETKLTAEIVELWGVHKDGKATMRRTRAELKALRLELGAKLHTMKSILVRTGRGGGWAAYLRSQRLALATADKYVAEHAASLTRPEEKLLEEELSKPTVDQVRQLAQKLLPKLCDVLTTAELVHGFIDELFWSLEAAVGRETDDGLEVFRASHEDAASVKAQAAELAEPAPAVP
jgi:hypothetical protein